MRKIAGWALIIFCSINLLIFGIALTVFIPELLTNDSESQMTTQELLTTSFGFLIVIFLLVLGLMRGLKKIKKEKDIEILNYDKELNISLTGQIEYKDYRNLIFGLTFRKPVYLVALGIATLFTLTLIVNIDKVMNQFETTYFVFVIFIGVFLISPIITLYQIKRLYNTNKIFHEQLNYVLGNDSIHIKGKTIDSIQKWNHFFEIRETRNFLMFYQGKMIATLLDKKMFSENELQEFKAFIKSLSIKRV